MRKIYLHMKSMGIWVFQLHVVSERSCASSRSQYTLCLMEGATLLENYVRKLAVTDILGGKLEKIFRQLTSMNENLSDLKKHVADLDEKVVTLEGSLNEVKDAVEKQGKRLRKQKRNLERFEQRLVHVEYSIPMAGRSLRMGSSIPHIRPGHGLLETDSDLIDAPPYT